MVPPGGSSTLYGVLYQILATLHHSIRLSLQRKAGSVLGATVTAEPSNGGDLRIESSEERSIEQWKARTTGRRWSLGQIVDGVLPDLYRDPALESPDNRTQYVFATEGQLADRAVAVFERLRDHDERFGPLKSLTKEDRSHLRKMAEAVRKGRKFRSEPKNQTYLKLRRLLARLKFRVGENAERLELEIDRWLLPLVDIREDRADKRKLLCELVLKKAAQGEVEIVPNELLREAGLSGVSLKHKENCRLRARAVLEEEAQRRGYNRDHDVRTVPSWPPDKPILVLAGDSGQGKTWMLARLALDLASDETTVGTMAVFLVSQEDVAQVPDQAADLLWQQAWDRDHQKSLDRVAAHWREVHGNIGRAWLTVCVDGVQSLEEARCLIDSFHWHHWGIRLALSVPSQVGNILFNERQNATHLHTLRDFTLLELRDYLRHFGRMSEELPADVRETLRRPLLARVYTSIDSGPEWQPTREYQLYEEYWRTQQIARSQHDHPEDFFRMKRLALTLLDEQPSYPWTWSQLDQAGLTDDSRTRLEQIGWLVRTQVGVEVWHDRLASWALAEAVVESTDPGQIAEFLRRDRLLQGSPRLRRILAYLTLDVFWLLSGESAKASWVPGLIQAIEVESALFGLHSLYEKDLPSLGSRIIPGLIERLRRLPADASDSHRELTVKALSTILAAEPDEGRVLPELLADASQQVRDVAVGALTRHPQAAAASQLWNRLSESSLLVDASQGSVGLATYRTTYPALQACLDINPGWLRSKILEADPELEPLWELAYLLADNKDPTARSIWLEVKNELFLKMPLDRLRSLAICIRVFLDSDESSLLESWLPVREDRAGPKAYRSLAWVNPDRALHQFSTLPVEDIVGSDFCSWLPVSLLTRPGTTRQAIRDRLIAANSDFWEIAELYEWREEELDYETVRLLLDRLAIDISNTSATPNSLRRPLRTLSRVVGFALLQAFEERANTDLDWRLGALGDAAMKAPDHVDLATLHAVLLKIGGSGIRHLIRSGLASQFAERRGEALYWGWMVPEELLGEPHRTPEVNALLGEDSALVEAIVETEVDDPFRRDWRREWLADLECLRSVKSPMTDEDLAPAFAALRSDSSKKKMRGLDAIAISGRADLLAHLEEWLESFVGLTEDERDELDRRAALLVLRLAEGSPEFVGKIAQNFDFSRFPSILSIVYGRRGAECLPERLDKHLQSCGNLNQFGVAEMSAALNLARTNVLSQTHLQRLWDYGKDSYQWNRGHFWKTVSGLNNNEMLEELWTACQGHRRIMDERLAAIQAWARLNPESAFEFTVQHLRRADNDREKFVFLLSELDQQQAIPILLEQAVGERQSTVLWSIARVLRRATHTVEPQIQSRLRSRNYKQRLAAVHLAGWLGPGFFRVDLERMALEDPDDDVRWECLQALSRQKKERLCLELMEAFRNAEGFARWSYLEAILQLGDPVLLRMKEDPLWLGSILLPVMGAFEIHSRNRIDERIQELQRTAKRRDDQNRN